jgi:hypothetical protein
MTKKDKNTPLQAGRAYAAEHPEFEGQLLVKTQRRKTGRWGGAAHQYSGVWVAGGQAALVKSLHVKNGPCYACGRVCTDPVLDTAYRYDERAGQPLGEADLAHWKRYSSDDTLYVYDAVCRVRDVCPACVGLLGLGPLPQKRQVERPTTDRHVLYCTCEPAGFVASDRRPPVVYIDLTKRETE